MTGHNSENGRRLPEWVAFYLSLDRWEGISQTVSGKGEREEDTLLLKENKSNFDMTTFRLLPV